jgi:3-deoxy-D-manno-octulosonic-acid transferase
MEQKGNHPLLDLSFYLPGDTEKPMQMLIEALRPTALVIVKYEFWYNLLRTCNQRQIPVISICCILREKSFRQVFLSTHLRNCLPLFSRIFVQNAESARLIRNLNLDNFQITGDTRVDRVLEIREKEGELSWLPAWKEGHKLLIIGSAWAEDLIYLKDFIRHAVLETDGLWRLLIVPHEVTEAQIQQLTASLGFPLQRFSTWEQNSDCDILLLDKVGLLSSAYRYAEAAWIGGGFRTGLHNVLEAAVYQIPVGFGPKYAKFREAAELIEIGIAKSYPEGGSVWEFYQERSEPSDENERLRQATANYFQSQKGAASTITQYLLHPEEADQ